MVDLELLQSTVKKSGLRNLFIAEKLGLSPEGYYKKLRGTTEFKVSEVACLSEILRLTAEERDSIFFAN